MNLDELLTRAASSDFANYHPGHLIEAVNALVPLGKTGALDAIEAYLAKVDLQTDARQGLFLVLRVSFEVPADPGYHPRMRIGGSMPPYPEPPAALPHFPIVMIDDVPLLMVSGYALGGDAEPVASHIKYFRDHGKLRTRPLMPTGAPADLFEKYKVVYRRVYGSNPSPREVAFIEAQLDRLR